MPRNGSGTASVPNTFTPLSTADANDVNENFTDIATMITDSLPRSGEAGMTGQFLAISGSASAPGVAFNTDTDTGLRRSAANEIAVVCGGADVATASSTGLSVSTAPTAGNNLANKTYVDAQVSPRGPTGSVSMFAASTAPTGWLECDGAAVSRTTYAALFAVIGTTWGVGNGSTTFNVPDLRGEFVRGWDHGKGTDTGRAFASSQADLIENHVHPGATNPETDTLGGIAELGGAQTGGGGVRVGTSGAASISVNFPALSFTTGNNTGGGAETRPRNIALMYIIKT